MEANGNAVAQDKNHFTVVAGALAMKVVGSKIIVKEDKFKTGYECKTCGGDRFIPETNCPCCKGLGKENSSDVFGNAIQTTCRVCEGSRLAKCPDCDGKGALLVVAQTSERRPTTGIITSCGPEVGLCDCFKKMGMADPECGLCNGKGKKGDRLKLGDHVLYSSYAGHRIDFKNRAVVVIMGEEEVLSRVFLTKDSNFSQLADFKTTS